MKTLRVLHIDDDPEERQFLEACLADVRGYAFEIESVTDTTQAEQCLAERPFDLLIADNRLSGSDRYRSGSSFLAYLIDQGDARPKILLSGAPPELLHDRTQALIANGCLAFVPKDALSGSVLLPIISRFAQVAADPASVQPLHTFLKPVLPFDDFESAASNLTRRLRSRYGFRLAMMTRVSGEDWIVLNAADGGYGVKAGDVYTWSDSFCSRMVAGYGPMISANVGAVPVYQEAPVADTLDIACYLGIPICRSDGSLFGTICAIDPEPRNEVIEADLPEILYECKLLGTVLNGELQREDIQRDLERAVSDSKLDELSGLYNRRGWDDLAAAEERRCIRYGHPASVLALDLDDLKRVNDSEGHEAGDRLIVSAASVLRSTVRREDVVARLGGDEFAVLAVESTAEQARELVGRLRQRMDEAGIGVSIGWAQRPPHGVLADVLGEADAQMYADKKARKSRP